MQSRFWPCFTFPCHQRSLRTHTASFMPIAHGTDSMSACCAADSSSILARMQMTSATSWSRPRYALASCAWNWVRSTGDIRIQPTHTRWTETGAKEPLRFNPSSVYDVPPDITTPTGELVERYSQASEAFAATVAASANVQREQVAAFRRALAEGDKQAALVARNAMWEALRTMFLQVYDLADVWNSFASRTAESEF